jgi:hypothetical protein
MKVATKTLNTSEKKKVAPTPIAIDEPKRRGRPSTRTPRAPTTHMGFEKPAKANEVVLLISATGFLKFSDMVQFKITTRNREKYPEKAAFVDQWNASADLGVNFEVRLNKAGATYLYSVIPEIINNLKTEGGRGTGPYYRTLQKIEDTFVEKFGFKPRKPASPAVEKKQNPAPTSGRGRPRKNVEAEPVIKKAVVVETLMVPAPAKKKMQEVKPTYVDKGEKATEAVAGKRKPRNMSNPGVSEEEEVKPKIKLKRRAA